MKGEHPIEPPWVREPEKWTCPQCGSHNLSAPEAVVWTCVDCGCRKSWEAFARSLNRRRGEVAGA